jgi:3-isopropylmalate/(R)-2-methylmalate dehydratase large subunit
MMLFLCRTLGMQNAFKAVEYGGDAVRAMPMQERLVLTNMAAELGAETGLIEPDAVTLAAIRQGGGEVADEAMEIWRSDRDAVYEARHVFDAARLAPQVALPNSPANAGPVEAAGGRAIDQAYIGACVGAKLEDLHMAARVLQGRKVAAGVRLMVAPASAATTRKAAADGTLATLTEAGAILLPTGCGACAGYGAGVLADGEVCISSTNRNFKGRMGHMNSEVYLGSPYTVAASAVAGRIADPRSFLTEAA